jgi:formate hydrogenlyase transcriptional activator
MEWNYLCSLFEEINLGLLVVDKIGFVHCHNARAIQRLQVEVLVGTKLTNLFKLNQSLAESLIAGRKERLALEPQNPLLPGGLQVLSWSIPTDVNSTAIILFDENSSLKQHEMLRVITEGTASLVGGDFFRSLAYNLILTTGLRYVTVTECTNLAKTRLRTLVYIERGNFLDNFEYDVQGTPCDIVMKGNNYFCSDELDILFPASQGIKSYFGVPLFLSNGEVAGHISMFDTVPKTLTREQLDILKIFASRAAAEIERKQKDELIRENMSRYQDLFESSPIGLVEEDFSKVRLYIIQAKEKYNIDLESIFNVHPHELEYCTSLVKRVAVNRAQRRLFGVNDISEYDNAITRSFEADLFKSVFVSFDKGQLVYEREIEYRLGDGTKKHLKTKRAFTPGGEADWSRCILSCVDISEQKTAEQRLTSALNEVGLLKEKLEEENFYLKEEIKRDHNFEEIVSKGITFKKVLQKIEQVAQTDATVLILGESGTGKELIARAIHSISKRCNRPLVKINCAALPANLIESELFGHEKGAFTGATSQRLGRFELAHHGSIFLDEIGELPIELQSKLLRVLQEGEFERLGSTKTIKVDVRVIAATNRDLHTSIQSNEFRADLYYRLNVFPVHAPALRERKEDIPLLVTHFCNKYAKKFGKKVTAVSKAALDSLMLYDWPGNVRELENVIERAIIVTNSHQLDVGEWLPKMIVEPRKIEQVQTEQELLTLQEMERRYITEILNRTKWKIRGENGAATLLNINPTTLEARMKKLFIQRPSRQKS